MFCIASHKSPWLFIYINPSINCPLGLEMQQAGSLMCLNHQMHQSLLCTPCLLPCREKLPIPFARKRGKESNGFDGWMNVCGLKFMHRACLYWVTSTPSSHLLTKHCSTSLPYEIYSRPRACTWIFDLFVSSFCTTAFPPVAVISLSTGTSKTSALFCDVKVVF